MMVTREQVKQAMDAADDMDLSDGAYWQFVHDKLGLPYGDVFEIISANHAYFGTKVTES